MYLTADQLTETGLLTSFSQEFGATPQSIRRWATRGFLLQDGRRVFLPVHRKNGMLYATRSDIRRFLAEVRRVGLKAGKLAAMPDDTPQPERQEAFVCSEGRITSPPVR